jgi:TRAP-type C4-dicarboxylate transport system permease small subunit
MRALLNKLYDGCAALAAASMVALLITILLGIIDRYVKLNIKGTDAYAGYFMAGAGFLALAHTLKRGEHIRVTLLLQAMKPAMRRKFELLALVIATLLAGLFFFFALRFTIQSHTLHDISTSLDATPLWIPQIVMVIGTFALLVAFIDELVIYARGGTENATTDLIRSE